MISHDILVRMRSDPSEFRRHIKIEGSGELVPLVDVIDDWQDKDFQAADAGWLRAIGAPVPDDTISRFYFQRPRGHSKSSDIAIMATWAIAFSSRQIRGAAFAADRDQAKLILDAVELVIKNNAWLQEVLAVQNYCVINTRTDSALDIMSADVASSYGLLLDFLLIDEVTNWTDSGERLWDSLASTIAKKQNTIAIIISNAGLGMGESWQWRIHESCRKSPRWHYSHLDGPQASWITENLLEEQRQLLPTLAYQRLWENRWTASKGDALSLEDIENCIDNNLQPMVGAEPGFTFYAGLDLGVRRDHSALVVLAADAKHRRVRLAHAQSWAPMGGAIDLGRVRQACIDISHRFHIRTLYYDRWQAELLIQDVRRDGHVQCEAVEFSGKSAVGMASAVLEAFRQSTVTMYRDAAMIRDLSSLTIVERPGYGYRLSAPRDRTHGHADRAMALAICLPPALRETATGGDIPVELMITGVPLNRTGGRVCGADRFGALPHLS